LLDYDLGEMRSASGASLRYEVEETAAAFSLAICRLIESSPVYLELKNELKSGRVISYFHRVVKAEIYDVALKLAVLRWYIRNDKTLAEDQKIITAPNTGVFRLLKQVWADQQIVLKLVPPTLKNVLAEIKHYLLNPVKKMVNRNYRAKYAGAGRSIQTGQPTIALEYSEGLDVTQKSDFIWFPQSKIEPSRVLVYFYDRVNAGSEVLRSIEKMGLKWICLRPGAVQVADVPVWMPPPGKRKEKKVSRDSIEKWLDRKGIELREAVAFWEGFYRQFGIKLDFAVGEGMPRHIAQIIAFDRIGDQGGFLLGKQRSEMYLTPLATFGHYDKNIFFTWAKRYNNYLVPYNHVDVNIVTGYGHDMVFGDKLSTAGKLRAGLQTNGARFIVALFDNMHGREKHFSTEMMSNFYAVFLRWLIDDREVGLIIKSKKAQVLENLPAVLSLLAKAEATGRCIRLDREVNRLPLDASKESDLAVGIGISSAVIEAVLAGGRGIHCDLTALRRHEFYRWGAKKIIFDDLDEMMAVLKKFKNDRNSYPELGDWSKFLDQLDPFRDGRAGERMGTYMRWCLEGFEAGLCRKEVLSRANQRYLSSWGKDKVIQGEAN